jgi:hypothetical protein
MTAGFASTSAKAGLSAGKSSSSSRRFKADLTFRVLAVKIDGNGNK